MGRHGFPGILREASALMRISSIYIYTRNLKFAQLVTELASLAIIIIRMIFSASNNLL